MLLSLETEPQTISSTVTHNYVLYVWLENDPNVNQADPNGVDLRSGNLSFKVAFRAKQS